MTARTISHATIAEYVAWQPDAACADPASRALIIYRRALDEGFITAGQRIVVWIDLDEVVNAERVTPHISINSAPPGEDPFAAIHHAELPYGTRVEFTISDPDRLPRWQRFKAGDVGTIIAREYADLYSVQVTGRWFGVTVAIDAFRVLGLPTE